MNRIITFARRQQSRNVRVLIEINPQPAHRIMHAGKDAHRHMARVVAHKHFVNLQNRPKLFIKRLSRDVCQIEIDLVFAVGAEPVERLSPFARGAQTRPPSPRADSLIKRSLSSPGIEVGCTWMNSPLAYLAPC